MATTATTNIERAKLYELDTNGQKIPNDPPIDVCFNPKEYSLEKSVPWEPSKAHEDAPVLEFKSPSAMTLSVTLQFDTYEERLSVRDKYVRRLERLSLMKGKAKNDPNPKNHAPPRCMFVWGQLMFRGVLTSLTQKYTMFLADGTPVRAEVSIKMQQVDDNAAALDAVANTITITGKAPSPYQVKPDDRLDLIASNMLTDATRWKDIAELNGIDNPFDMSDWVGQTIMIPA
jgi:Contractile injection system tube protein/LysM domain